MNLAELKLGEYLAQARIALLEVLQVELGALLDERKHDVNLSSLVDLLSDAVVETGRLVVILVQGDDGLAARRQFVDDAHVEVAIDGHGQCARYGRGGHDEYVWRFLALGPQFGALGHTKSVLLVDHRHAEAPKLHVVLNDGVRAHQDVDRPIGQSFEHLLAAFALHDARQQFHTDVHSLQKRLKGGQVLLGENLRRRHHAGLETVVERQQHHHECHQRLARSHVAL